MKIFIVLAVAVAFVCVDVKVQNVKLIKKKN